MKEAKVLSLLKQVLDPLTGRDLPSVGMIGDVKSEEKIINITINTRGHSSNQKTAIYQNIINAINQVAPEVYVNLHFKAESNTAKINSSTPQIKNIIAVASGKGGVGKSTLSVNLAYALRDQSMRVGLLDADLYGPSIPTMLNLEGKRHGVRTIGDKHKLVPLEAYDIPVVSIGNVVGKEQAVVLRGPRLGGIIKQFFQEVIWPDLDILIVDLPPGTGDVQLTMVQTVPVTGAIIITTPQTVAVSDAVRASNMFLLDNIKVPILGVVENMSWFSPADLPTHRYNIFGQGGGDVLAKKINTKLLGQVPIVMGIREMGDKGKPIYLSDNEEVREIYSSLAESLLAQLEKRNDMWQPTQKVEIKTS